MLAPLRADERQVGGRPSDGSVAERREWLSRVVLFAGLMACALMAVIGEPWRGWLLVTLISGAAIAGMVALGHDGRRSNPTWFLTVGAVLLVPAYILWYPARLHWDLQLGSPAITDWLFLAGYAAFLIGLARLIGLRNTDGHRVDVLDTLIIGVGMGVVVWVIFIGPYLNDESMSWAARIVAISYTVVDLLLVGAVIRMLVQDRISTTGDKLLAGWVVTQLAADLHYSVTTLQGTFSLAGVGPVIYSVSFVLLAAALLHPTTMASNAHRRPRPMSGFRRFAIVVPATLVAPAVLTVLGTRVGSREIAIVAVLSGALFALVLLRIWHLMVDVEDHRRIQRQLTTSMEQQRQRTEENRALLASLRERQMLAERLSRIQRKISTRAPLQEVLDAITQGAAELLHDDVAALRLIDEHDPSTMVMVASVGVPEHIVEAQSRLPVGHGVGGRAIVDNQLCIQDSYAEWEGAIPSFVSGGLQTAMAAPVRLGTRAIGSLVVATFESDRRYSAAEQDALTSFAEHVGLALNDARSVRALNDALDQAVHQAMHDELTGLPNRACFYDRTEQALRMGRREDTATAVLLFDLDRFKEINDTLGHRYGDRVLQAIGPRILPLLRESDTLARLGGDEFCVLLPRAEGVEAAMEVAHRITVALEEPLEVDGMTLVVAASCGVTVAPDHGDTADLLLQRADVAMYVAKTSRLDVAAYEDRLDRNTPDRLALVGELRRAIAEDRLVLHYQPQLTVRTGEVEGVEALVRWQHERRGLLAPEAFIPMAEDTGLIHQITSWVLDEALRQLSCWIADPAVELGEDFTVAVNVSTQSLLDESFAVEVAVALDRFGIAPHHLVLEVTETTIMADPEHAKRVLDSLAGLGVQFSIDDFGTGYSSLAALKDLPVHHLKIDKSFVLGMHEDADAETIVRSVIDLGHTLGLRTVAEGVELDTVWDLLAILGCDAAQGYLLSHPLCGPEMARWLVDRQVQRRLGSVH